MKRVIYNIEGINYIYDARRKGAKYSFDGGQTWKNNGEAVEIVLKWALGLKATKDGNTPFDKGSDIEEYKASVKSPKFTLTTCNIGNDKETIVSEYFKRTASKQTVYGYIAGEELITYWMNMEEFGEYLKEFGYYDNHSGYVRGKALSNKMVTWFEKRVIKQMTFFLEVNCQNILKMRDWKNFPNMEKYGN